MARTEPDLSENFENLQRRVEKARALLRRTELRAQNLAAEIQELELQKEKLASRPKSENSDIKDISPPAAEV